MLFLFFSAPSAPPLNVSLSIISPTAVNLTWSPPPLQHHNGIIVSYVIAVTELITNTTNTLTTSNTSLTVADLHPHYTYVLKVAAITVEQGPYSNKTSVTMPQDGTYRIILVIIFMYIFIAPSSPPTNIIIDIINSTTVECRWEPPLNNTQNGVIQEYNIVILEIETNTSYFEETDLESLLFLITYLHPYYHYNISIKAVTVAPGPLSNAMTVLLPEDGTRKINFIEILILY